MDGQVAGLEGGATQDLSHPLSLRKSIGVHVYHCSSIPGADAEQPVRVATWVKDHYPPEKFDATFPAFSEAYWSKGINISTPEGVVEALDGIFSPEEVKEIIKNALSPANKQRVIDQTMSASAFGAPWIVGVNSEQERRDWFGNDRWEQVFDHLHVPYTPVRILPPEEAKAKL